MARIFRQTYSKPIPKGAEIVTLKGKRYARFKNRQGKIVTAPLTRDGKRMIAKISKWYINFRDADGTIRSRAGFTDKKATEQFSAQLEKQAERRRVGIVDVEISHLQRPLREHLDDYLDDLRRAGRDDMYVYNTDKRLHKLIDQCGWYVLAKVTSDCLSKWLGSQDDGGMAPRTQNQYIETASAFMNWLIRHRRAEVNPLQGIAKADASEKVRVRRALSMEEISRFLGIAGDRRPIYLTALLTGLRRSELADLQWGDVQLEHDMPHVALRAAKTKSKRADVIPLAPELAEELRAIRPTDVSPSAPVFKRIPSMEVYRADLRAAQIPYKDDMDRQADFHAFRMSFGTILAQSGINIRTAMELMRHKDIRLTTQTYTDPRLLDTNGAVQALPRLGKGSDSELMKATGTDGRPAETPPTGRESLSSSLSSQRTSGGISQSSSGTKTGKISQAEKGRKPLTKSSVSTTCHQEETPCHPTHENGMKNWGTRIRT